MKKTKRIMIGWALLSAWLVSGAGWGASPQENRPEPAVIAAPPGISAAGQTASPPLTLTLTECIEKALKANLDLSIEAINPAMAEESVWGMKDPYMPRFRADSTYINQDIPSTWGVEGPTVQTKQDYFNFNLSQQIVTGTDISVGLSSRRTDTSRAYTTVNPSYYSEFRFSLTQPLLKGFGPKINRVEIVKAEHRLDESVSALKIMLLATIYNVEEAYWNLFYARENLRMTEASLSQSRETLQRSREAARIGSKSEIEVLSAETEVASRENSLLSVRNNVEKMENRLKALLNLPVGGESDAPEARIPIYPADKPSAVKREVSYAEAMRMALAERPDLAQYRSRIDDAALDISYNKNQLLPQLDLQFSFWNPGQSGVKYVFQDNNPLSGIILDKITGSRGDSFRDMLKKNYKNISFNVTLSIPLSNFLSRAGLARARLAEDQARLNLEKARKSIELDVMEAVKDLDVGALKIESSARYRELMEKRVEAESRRYQLGLVGSEWLFSYQRNLDQAKADEIRAIIDYRIAQARLDRVMGTTLKTKGLKFRDFEF
jgi:outer membrane protein TolC